MRSLLQAIHLRRTRPEGLNGVLRGPYRPNRRAHNCCTIVAFGRPGSVVDYLLVAQSRANHLGPLPRD